MKLKDKIPKNIEKLLKILSQEDSLFGEIYIDCTENFKLIVEPDRIDEINWGKEEGIALRKVDENFKNHFTFSSDLKNFSSLEDLAKTFTKEFSFNKKGPENSEKKEFRVDVYYNYLKEKLEFLEELRKRVKKVEAIKHYKIGLSEVKKEILIINSDDIWVEDIRFYSKLFAIVVAEKDGLLERGYEVFGATLPFKEIKELPEVLSISERASDLALIMLSARKAPAGIMPVILSGTAGGTMIHEAVGHGLEADHAEEGLSIYSGRIGEKVASELITVVDDATLPSLYGFYRFDDEGTTAEKVVLIEKGVLKNYLYDKYFALKYGKKSNGHGRRQDYRHIPIPRMANTYIERGPHKPEEIIKSIERGLLVKKMGGGEVNPLTGDFVFEVREGYYIDKGEIAYPVKGATLVGNGPKVLEIIDMVGDDLKFIPGTCGKDGQGVPVADGQPTLRIPEITVGGTLD
ncbi:MAG: peptidase C69 [Thermodesulfobacterium geofontis]|uniref:Peptidase C69 n=1 Tax=Thermodesulfobacterium geofontis TaxID=1295609 RepID=A0A2N7PPY8_9BACT|nr:MAG: peptidase C69 [Thermodesulfobacterium geofontis]